MRNLDAFNAMTVDGQRNALIEYFQEWKSENEVVLDLWDLDVPDMVSCFIDWLYDTAE